MKLLWKAAVVTMRQLGINAPTTIKVILGGGIWVLVAVSLSDAETDSVKGFVLRLLDPIAGTIAVAGVFVPLLVWNTVKVARRDQSINASLRLAADSAASIDGRIKSFLRNALSDPCYGIAQVLSIWIDSQTLSDS